MCGISGIISFKKKIINSENILNLMKSRGPDAQGQLKKVISDSHINLFASRLKIIDLDNRSNQPFKFRNTWISFNGEIYNYLEIRKKLESLGKKFYTTSDIEVAIQAYNYWGEKCFEKFDGMWAICILDVDKKKIDS